LKTTAWRLVKSRRAADAFSGEGARRFPGRWNHRGTPIVYLAGSLSLVALEVLANLDDTALLRGYVSIEVVFDARMCKKLTVDSLPEDWNEVPTPTSTRDIGTLWAEALDSCLLAVPSAIISDESNYLLNPLHADIRKVQFGPPKEFDWDPRLGQR